MLSLQDDPSGQEEEEGEEGGAGRSPEMEWCVNWQPHRFAASPPGRVVAVLPFLVSHLPGDDLFAALPECCSLLRGGGGGGTRGLPTDPPESLSAEVHLLLMRLSDLVSCRALLAAASFAASLSGLLQPPRYAPVPSALQAAFEASSPLHRRHPHHSRLSALILDLWNLLLFHTHSLPLRSTSQTSNSSPAPAASSATTMTSADPSSSSSSSSSTPSSPTSTIPTSSSSMTPTARPKGSRKGVPEAASKASESSAEQPSNR